MAELYPMLQTPVLKTTLWGGRRLRDLYGKAAPADAATGESWELADHPHGTSTVANGPLAGRSLRQIVESHAEALFGKPVLSAWRDRLPLLVKIIDADQDLSIQVHPDDAYTAAHGMSDVGKTECWVILHAEPGAQLITGVKPGVGREEFRRAAEAGQLADMLVEQPVRAGDFLFIPAGRLHAIGAGIVLAEFQQPSDTTYRVYDWGRMGTDGKPRPLHLDQAMECIDFDGRLPPSGGHGVVTDGCGVRIESLVECDKFYLDRATIEMTFLSRSLYRGFECAMIVEGEGFLTVDDTEVTLPVRAGQTVLVPACAGKYGLRSRGTMTALMAGPPER
ncbi:MAG: class I mannose-6-phosphate isomerase [Planctomycetes bacterium]|nr:class I mannose-6-phosphate isomerase [Planctomycetota bacterium]